MSGADNAEDNRVVVADVDDVDDDVDEGGRSGLRLSWTFGVSSSIAGGVYELGPVRPHTLVYASAQTALLYDYVTGEQTLLQGHCGPIGCLAVSFNKRVCVSGDRDASDDALLVVWDTSDGWPLKTLPFPSAASALALSADGTLVAALTADSSSKQRLVIWEWTSNPSPSSSAFDMPVVFESEVPITLKQAHSVRFDVSDPTQLVTTAPDNVVFWRIDMVERRLQWQRPSRGLSKLQHNVGDLVASISIPYRTQVVSGTTTGDIVLWDIAPGQAPPPVPGSEDALMQQSQDMIRKRDAIKTIRATKRGAVTVIDVIDQFIVIGARDGSVRFFDFQFRIVGWFEDINAGPITSISFATAEDRHEEERSGEKFEVPEFIVSTLTGKIVRLSAASMAESDTGSSDSSQKRQRGFLLVQGFEANVRALAAHASLPLFAVGCSDGTLRLIQYENRTIVSQRRLEHAVTALAFGGGANGSSGILGVGLSDGQFMLVDGHSLAEVHSFHSGPEAINAIAFSADAKYASTADRGRCVALYRIYHREEQRSQPLEWMLVGRHRSHSDAIISLSFESYRARAAPRNELDAPVDRLLSLGRDRILQEYDVLNSGMAAGLLLRCSTEVEADSIPTALLTQPYRLEHAQDTIIIANDAYKARKWVFVHDSSAAAEPPNEPRDTTEDDPTPVCVRTVLTPAYGEPVNRMICLNAVSVSGSIVPSHYAAYATPSHLIGLMKLPLDGNPERATAVIAHPDGVECLAQSWDGRFLLTAGKRDRCVHLWTLELDTFEHTITAEDTAAVQSHQEQQHRVVLSSDIRPFIGLLGRDGDPAVYDELLDYFDYAQLRQQGENATGKHSMGDSVEVEQLVNMCRALGFYPSDYDIANMHAEIAFVNDVPLQKLRSTDIKGTPIDLEQFIKMFVNHRPQERISIEHIEQSFRTILNSGNAEEEVGDDEQALVPRDALLNALQNHGEKMSEREIRQCLEELGSSIEELPEEASAKSFANGVLGFEDAHAESTADIGSS